MPTNRVGVVLASPDFRGANETLFKEVSSYLVGEGDANQLDKELGIEDDSVAFPDSPSVRQLSAPETPPTAAATRRKKIDPCSASTNVFDEWIKAVVLMIPPPREAPMRRKQLDKAAHRREQILLEALDLLETACYLLQRRLAQYQRQERLLLAYHDAVEEDVSSSAVAAQLQPSDYHRWERMKRREVSRQPYITCASELRDRLSKIRYILQRLEELEGLRANKSYSRAIFQSNSKGYSSRLLPDAALSLGHGDDACDGSPHDPTLLMKDEAGIGDSAMQESSAVQHGSSLAERQRNRRLNLLAQRVSTLHSQLRLPVAAPDISPRLREELLLSFSSRVLALRASTSSSSVASAAMQHQQRQITGFVEWYVNQIMDPIAISRLLGIVPVEYVVTTTCRLVYACEAHLSLRAARALPDLSRVVVRAIAEGRNDSVAQLSQSSCVSYLSALDRPSEAMLLFYVGLLGGQLEVLQRLLRQQFFHAQALHVLFFFYANWSDAVVCAAYQLEQVEAVKNAMASGTSLSNETSFILAGGSATATSSSSTVTAIDGGHGNGGSSSADVSSFSASHSDGIPSFLKERPDGAGDDLEDPDGGDGRARQGVHRMTTPVFFAGALQRLRVFFELRSDVVQRARWHGDGLPSGAVKDAAVEIHRWRSLEEEGPSNHHQNSSSSRAAQEGGGFGKLVRDGRLDGFAIAPTLRCHMRPAFSTPLLLRIDPYSYHLNQPTVFEGDGEDDDDSDDDAADGGGDMGSGTYSVRGASSLRQYPGPGNSTASTTVGGLGSSVARPASPFAVGRRLGAVLLCSDTSIPCDGSFTVLRAHHYSSYALIEDVYAQAVTDGKFSVTQLLSTGQTPLDGYDSDDYDDEETEAPFTGSSERSMRPLKRHSGALTTMFFFEVQLSLGYLLLMHNADPALHWSPQVQRSTTSTTTAAASVAGPSPSAVENDLARDIVLMAAKCENRLVVGLCSFECAAAANGCAQGMSEPTPHLGCESNTLVTADFTALASSSVEAATAATTASATAMTSNTPSHDHIQSHPQPHLRNCPNSVGVSFVVVVKRQIRCGGCSGTAHPSAGIMQQVYVMGLCHQGNKISPMTTTITSPLEGNLVETKELTSSPARRRVGPGKAAAAAAAAAAASALPVYLRIDYPISDDDDERTDAGVDSATPKARWSDGVVRGRPTSGSNARSGGSNRSFSNAVDDDDDDLFFPPLASKSQSQSRIRRSRGTVGGEGRRYLPRVSRVSAAEVLAALAAESSDTACATHSTSGSSFSLPGVAPSTNNLMDGAVLVIGVLFHPAEDTISLRLNNDLWLPRVILNVRGSMGSPVPTHLHPAASMSMNKEGWTNVQADPAALPTAVSASTSSVAAAAVGGHSYQAVGRSLEVTKPMLRFAFDEEEFVGGPVACPAFMSPVSRRCGGESAVPPPRLLDNDAKFSQMLRQLTRVDVVSMLGSSSAAAGGSDMLTPAITTAATTDAVPAGPSTFGTQSNFGSRDRLVREAVQRVQQLLNSVSRSGTGASPEDLFFTPIFIYRRSANNSGGDGSLSSSGAAAAKAAVAAAASSGGDQQHLITLGRELFSRRHLGHAVSDWYTIIAEGARMNPLCAALCARQRWMAYSIAIHPLTQFVGGGEGGTAQRRMALLAACAVGYDEVLMVLLERMPVDELLPLFGIVVEGEAKLALQQAYAKTHTAFMRSYILRSSRITSAGEGLGASRTASPVKIRPGTQRGDAPHSAGGGTPTRAPYLTNRVQRDMLDPHTLYSSQRPLYTPLHCALLGFHPDEATELADVCSTAAPWGGGPGRAPAITSTSHNTTGRPVACMTVLLNCLYDLLVVPKPLLQKAAHSSSAKGNVSAPNPAPAGGLLLTTTVSSSSRSAPDHSSTLLRDALNVLSRAGESVLLIAIRQRRVALATRLLRLGANPACVDRVTRALALEIACANGCAPIAEALLSVPTYATSPVLLNHQGVATPLCWCALNNLHSVLSQLLQLDGVDANIGLEESSPLLLSISFDNVDAALMLLEMTDSRPESNASSRGAPHRPFLDINAANSRTQCAPLHLACEHGQLRVVRALLARHAALNVVCKGTNATPLHLALLNGREAVALAILEYSKDQLRRGRCVLDLTAIDLNGDTALHHAARRGLSEAVEYLLVQFSEAEVARVVAMQPLLKQRSGVVTTIATVSYTVVNKQGKTPLLAAIQTEQVTTAELLISSAADAAEEREEEGLGMSEGVLQGGPMIEGTCTALHQAVGKRMDTVVLLMLAYPHLFPCSTEFRSSFELTYRQRSAAAASTAVAISASVVGPRLEKAPSLFVSPSLYEPSETKKRQDDGAPPKRSKPRIAATLLARADAQAGQWMESKRSTIRPQGKNGGREDGGGVVSDGRRKAASRHSSARRRRGQKQYHHAQQRRRNSFVRLLLTRAAAPTVPPAYALLLLRRGYTLPELFTFLSEVAAESAVVGMQSPTAMAYAEQLSGYMEEHWGVLIAPTHIVQFSREVLKELQAWMLQQQLPRRQQRCSSATESQLWTSVSSPSPQLTVDQGVSSSSWTAHLACVKASLARGGDLSLEMIRVIRLYGRRDSGSRAIQEMKGLLDAHIAKRKNTEMRRGRPTADTSETPLPVKPNASAKEAPPDLELENAEETLSSPMGYTALQLAASLGLAEVVHFLLTTFQLDPLNAPAQRYFSPSVALPSPSAPLEEEEIALMAATQYSSPVAVPLRGRASPSSASSSIDKSSASRRCDPSTLQKVLHMRVVEVADQQQQRYRQGDRMLTDDDADEQYTNGWFCYTPFRLAIRSGNTAAVMAILDHCSTNQGSIHVTNSVTNSSSGLSNSSMPSISELVNMKEPSWLEPLCRTALQEVIASLPSLPAYSIATGKDAGKKKEVLSPEKGEEEEEEVDDVDDEASDTMKVGAKKLTRESAAELVSMLLNHGASVNGYFDATGKDAWALAVSQEDTGPQAAATPMCGGLVLLLRHRVSLMGWYPPSRASSLANSARRGVPYISRSGNGEVPHAILDEMLYSRRALLRRWKKCIRSVTQRHGDVEMSRSLTTMYSGDGCRNPFEEAESLMDMYDELLGGGSDFHLATPHGSHSRGLTAQRPSGSSVVQLSATGGRMMKDGESGKAECTTTDVSGGSDRTKTQKDEGLTAESPIMSPNATVVRVARPIALFSSSVVSITPQRDGGNAAGSSAVTPSSPLSPCFSEHEIKTRMISALTQCYQTTLLYLCVEHNPQYIFRLTTQYERVMRLASLHPLTGDNVITMLLRKAQSSLSVMDNMPSYNEGRDFISRAGGESSLANSYLEGGGSGGQLGAERLPHSPSSPTQISLPQRTYAYRDPYEVPHASALIDICLHIMTKGSHTDREIRRVLYDECGDGETALSLAARIGYVPLIASIVNDSSSVSTPRYSGVPLGATPIDQKLPSQLYQPPTSSKGEAAGAKEAPTSMVAASLVLNLRDVSVRVLLATHVYYGAADASTIYTILHNIEEESQRILFLKWAYPNVHPIPALHLAVGYAAAASEFLTTVDCMNAFWLNLLYAQFTRQLDSIEISSRTWNELLHVVLPGAPAVPIYLIQQSEFQRTGLGSKGGGSEGNMNAAALSATLRGGNSSARPARRGRGGNGKSTDDKGIGTSNWIYVVRRTRMFLQLMSVSVAENLAEGVEKQGISMLIPPTASLATGKSLPRQSKASRESTASGPANNSPTTSKRQSAATTQRPSTGEDLGVKSALVGTLLWDVIELAVRYDDVEVLSHLLRLQLPDAVASFISDPSASLNATARLKPPAASLLRPNSGAKSASEAVLASYPSLFDVRGLPQVTAVLGRLQLLLWTEALQERHIDLLAIAAGSIRLLKLFYHNPSPEVRALVSVLRYDRIDSKTGLPEGAQPFVPPLPASRLDPPSPQAISGPTGVVRGLPFNDNLLTSVSLDASFTTGGGVRDSPSAGISSGRRGPSIRHGGNSASQRSITTVSTQLISEAQRPPSAVQDDLEFMEACVQNGRQRLAPKVSRRTRLTAVVWGVGAAARTVDVRRASPTMAFGAANPSTSTKPSGWRTSSSPPHRPLSSSMYHSNIPHSSPSRRLGPQAGALPQPSSPSTLIVQAIPVSSRPPSAATVPPRPSSPVSPPLYFMYLQTDWVMHATLLLQSPRPAVATIDTLLYLLGQRAMMSISALDLFLAASYPDRRWCASNGDVLSLHYHTRTHGDTLLHLLVINDQCQLAEYYLAFCLYYFALNHYDLEPFPRPGKYPIHEKSSVLSGDDRDGREGDSSDGGSGGHVEDTAIPVEFLRSMLRVNAYGLTAFDYANSATMLQLLEWYGCVPPTYRPNPHSFMEQLGTSSLLASVFEQRRLRPPPPAKRRGGPSGDEEAITRRGDGSDDFHFFPVPRLVLASDDFMALLDHTGNEVEEELKQMAAHPADSSALSASMEKRSSRTRQVTSQASHEAPGTEITLTTEQRRRRLVALQKRQVASKRRRAVYEKAKEALFDLVSSQSFQPIPTHGSGSRRNGATPAFLTAASISAVERQRERLMPPLSDALLMHNVLEAQRECSKVLLPILLSEEVSLLHLGLCSFDDELVTLYGAAASAAKKESDTQLEARNHGADAKDAEAVGQREGQQDGGLPVDQINPYNSLLMPPSLLLSRESLGVKSRTANKSDQKSSDLRHRQRGVTSHPTKTGDAATVTRVSLSSGVAAASCASSATLPPITVPPSGRGSVAPQRHSTKSSALVSSAASTAPVEPPLSHRDVMYLLEAQQFVVYPLALPTVSPEAGGSVSAAYTSIERCIANPKDPGGRSAGRKMAGRQRAEKTGGGYGSDTDPRIAASAAANDVPLLRTFLTRKVADIEDVTDTSQKAYEAAFVVSATPMQLAGLVMATSGLRGTAHVMADTKWKQWGSLAKSTAETQTSHLARLAGAGGGGNPVSGNNFTDVEAVPLLNVKAFSLEEVQAVLSSISGNGNTVAQRGRMSGKTASSRIATAMSTLLDEWVLDRWRVLGHPNITGGCGSIVSSSRPRSKKRLQYPVARSKPTSATQGSRRLPSIGAGRTDGDGRGQVASRTSSAADCDEENEEEEEGGHAMLDAIAPVGGVATAAQQTLMKILLKRFSAATGAKLSQQMGLIVAPNYDVEDSGDAVEAVRTLQSRAGGPRKRK